MEDSVLPSREYKKKLYQILLLNIYIFKILIHGLNKYNSNNIICLYIFFRWQCASIVFCTCSCEGGDSSQREGPVESPRQRGGRGFARSVALLADEQLWQVGGRCWDEGRGCRHRCRQRGTVITIVRPRRTARQIPETDRREPVHCWVSRSKYFFSYCYGGRLYCVSLKVLK